MAPFDDLPLSELMACDRMDACCSVPYRSPQRLAALAERTMLTLFIGEQVDRTVLYYSELFFDSYLDAHTTLDAEVGMAEYTAYQVAKLDEEAVNLLASTLPAITSVRFCIRESRHKETSAQTMAGVIQLLEHWASQLVSLGIWAKCAKPSTDIVIAFTQYLQVHLPLFSLINEKLTCLQYFTMAVPLLRKDDSPLDLSFIRRLKRFSMDLPKANYLDSLLHHGGGGALQGTLPEVRIFDWSILSSEGKAQLLTMPSSLALKITALAFNSPALQAKSFFAHFPGLKWYKQNAHEPIPVFKVPHFLDSLSVLSQLKYLEVRIHLSESGTADYGSVPSVVEEESLQPLPSVETLFIRGVISKQPIFSFFAPFQRRFPSLKKLYVEGVLSSEKEYNFQETATACMRQFAHHQLKGLLSLERWTPPTAMYREEFNFTEGRTFEDWHFTEVTPLK